MTHQNISIKSKIFVAGHNGMVGSAIVRSLNKKGYQSILCASRDELDLTNQTSVEAYLSKHQPDCIIIAAAKVGGIVANSSFPTEFIYDNTMIAFNLISAASRQGVKKLILLGSSCIYPKEATIPIEEDQLLAGPLEPTNRAYAIAKIAGLELIHSLRTQYKKDYFSLMPCNLYGQGDNFHPTHSHVIPGLIRRFVEAVKNNDREVVVWGTGTVRREFLYVDDCADGVIFAMEHLSDSLLQSNSTGNAFSHLNLGYGSDVEIRELVSLIKTLASFEGEVVYDSTKPDGTRRKMMSSDRINSLGWKPKISLEEGLRITLDWYHSNFQDLRN